LQHGDDDDDDDDDDDEKQTKKKKKKKWKKKSKNATPKAKTKAAQQQQQSLDDVSAVLFYGELYGGAWPSSIDENNAGEGAAVAAADDDDAAAAAAATVVVKAVQTEIFYSPQLEWCVFDVAIVRRAAAAGNTQEKTYLDFDEARALCKACALPFVRPLCRGSLADCLAMDLNFESTVPRLCSGGTRKNPPGNYAEGIVVRPVMNHVVTNDGSSSKKKAGKRVIFKRKAAAYTDKVQAHSKSRMLRFLYKGTLSKAEQQLLLDVATLINKTRAAAVHSKHGGSLLNKQELLLQDALADVQGPLRQRWLNVPDTKTRKLMRGCLLRLATQIIKEYK
jgi:Rnl2 family RNA ligase